jgi:hypothetical protein
MPVVGAGPAARRPLRGAGPAAWRTLRGAGPMMQGPYGGARPAVRPVAGRQLGSTEVGKEGERMGWRQVASGCAELVGCRHVKED